MKSSADLGWFYPPRPLASADNTLFDLQNSSYPPEPHSITAHYYTTQVVRGPITEINQSKCSISGPIFSKYRTGHCPEWSRSLCFLQSCNKSLINQACSGRYWENIGPRSFLYGPSAARSVQKRPRADILPVRPLRMVNKIYISDDLNS